MKLKNQTLKKTATLAIVILFQLVAVSCKNKQQKANDFVGSYNRYASFMTNHIVTSTSAKLLPNSDIEIKFYTALEYNDGNKEMFSQLAPGLMSNVFAKDRTAGDLLDEGVKFNVYFYSDKGVEFTSLVIDKQKKEELLHPKKLDLNDKTAAVGSNPNLSPELREMLTILNKSLPIENKAEGTKVTKIDIDKDNVLVYNVEVDDSLTEMLKEEGTKNLMKESIMRSNDFKVLKNGIQRLGVSKIKYLYMNSKGKTISEVFIDLNES